jgi:hypothetical protein
MRFGLRKTRAAKGAEPKRTGHRGDSCEFVQIHRKSSLICCVSARHADMRC